MSCSVAISSSAYRHGQRSLQVLPGGLARKCPVDIFAEAAISKEYLPAEGSSRNRERASLGMLR
ncbi:hypothetical protein Desor_5250 [Desulfosporosinus orientis DSM 765]|uniref:Uncharacterized protein n=2 Tax=Desulfosporosinus orientis TaxID=1563 RepID=G7W9R7_DESOD|nr:hypothetical protein Desor_5250 [Desulfosporosinus orientis DSM 765]